MQSHLRTYYLRRLVNHLVDATLTSPSLAEMVHHHLSVGWSRASNPPYLGAYQVYDERESYITWVVIDARAYSEALYQSGLALLRIAVNGALTSEADASFAHDTFPGQPFRTCQSCARPFMDWLDFYAHIKMEHWEDSAKAG